MGEKVLVVGAHGQLGQHLVASAPRGTRLLLPSHDEMPIEDTMTVLRYCAKHQPDVIINCAAFHNVQACEDEPEKAYAVNTKGVANLIVACATVPEPPCLVQISTDYVFDGKKNRPYEEEDTPNPLNVYGATKAEAEEYIKMSGLRSWYIVRISSLFSTVGSRGKGNTNFFLKMVGGAQSGQPASVVDDIVMSPTYALDAALAIWYLVTKRPPSGIYHASNRGECTWFEFATVIYAMVGRSSDMVRPRRTESTPDAAEVPKYSALSVARMEQAGWKMGFWTEALDRCIRSMNHGGV